MKCSELFKVLFYVIIASSILTSCQEDDFDSQEQFRIDAEIIQDYIEEHGLDATNVEYNGEETGVYLAIIDSSGSGEYPSIYSTVKVKYKGYNVNGSAFEDTEGEAYEFPLSGVIGGWRLAFPNIAKGDKATILIPSYYGYGPRAQGAIPANSVLIFDVELVDITASSIVEEQLKIDSAIIHDYINEHDLEAVNIKEDGVETGVYVAITEASGSDEYPTKASTVEVEYKGYLIDGTVVDSSRGGSVSFALSSVIVGWQIGFTAIAKGDKATILIPSSYGYGSQAVGSIPANSVLIFDVDLIDIPSNSVDE